MMNLRAGLLSGLIAVLVTSAVNLICRLVGVLPDQLDIKYLAELFIDPARLPATAFWVGLVLYIVIGALIGGGFVLLVKRPTPLKGIVFTFALVWLGLMLVIFPLTERGIFGLNIGWVMPIATFLLNMIYGIILGVFAQRLVVNVDNFGDQIGRALTKALNDAIEAESAGEVFTVDLASTRMIIFSDLHKGARDRADDFQIAERSYNAALGYYYHMEYTLVMLGDVEELWENQVNSVLNAYEYTLKYEAKFHQDNG